MDQTASSDQSLLWYFRERGQVADLDCVSVYVLVAIIKKRLKLSAVSTNPTDLSLTCLNESPGSTTCASVADDIDRISISS